MKLSEYIAEIERPLKLGEADAARVNANIALRDYKATGGTP